MERISLLLVDDEEAYRGTLASRLRRKGFDVLDVDSGQRALEAVKRARFDVAIIDLAMPGMDGLETLREIKRTNAPIEVIILTGYASVNSAAEGMRLGAFDYMAKPCDIDDLALRIRNAYQKKLAAEQST